MSEESASATTVRESGPIPMLDSPRPEQPAGREAIDAGVEEIRRLYGSGLTHLFPRLEDLIRRRLGVAPLSAEAAVLAGLTGVTVRLSFALLVTAFFGEWADIPWGRWAVILVFFGLMDASDPFSTPPPDVRPSPFAMRKVMDWTPLLPAIAQESDVQDLNDFIRRWYRLPAAATAGVAVAALILGVCRLFIPTDLSELPAGSIVLLALLLYDFGVLAYGNLFWWALMARQARYDHLLFWVSPADSPEVRKAMRRLPEQSRTSGFFITLVLVLTLVLVSWDSPVVLPLAVGFIVIGYLTNIGAALGDRVSVRKIVERARHQQLEELRQRIEPFRSRYTQLGPQESEQLRGLIDLHNVIRDAPAASTTNTLWGTAAGLILPTVVFVVTVFGEVTAERLLDAILP